MVNTELLFKFVHSPLSIGSILPSTAYLTKKILAPIQWNQAKSIIELGAGTGVFTKEIMAQKQKESQFLIVEQDKDMRRELEHTYGIQALYGSRAESLSYLCRKFQMSEVDYIISGLPFANIERERRNRIMCEIYSALKENGYFLAYQYSLQMENTLKSLFKTVRIDFELRNFPPAFIYICRK